jgi:hypothetical protein
MEQKTIRVVHITVDGKLHLVPLKDNILKHLQELVGGRIEVAKLAFLDRHLDARQRKLAKEKKLNGSSLVVYANEEGLLQRLEPNAYGAEHGIESDFELVGNLVLSVEDDEGEVVDLATMTEEVWTDPLREVLRKIVE